MTNCSKIIFVLIFFLPKFQACGNHGSNTNQYVHDVVIYGATPAGISSAVNAATEGAELLLIEETSHFGGLTSGGLSSVAVSASRVGFGGVRMEPTWTALGQAAGLAAAQAIAENKPVSEIDVTQLQKNLHQKGAITFYTSDVRPDNPCFEAVQFLGNRGVFQNLYYPKSIALGGFKKLGDNVQWMKARTYLDIQPDRIITEKLANEWLVKLNIQKEKKIHVSKGMTRCEFIIAVYDILLSAE